MSEAIARMTPRPHGTGSLQTSETKYSEDSPLWKSKKMKGNTFLRWAKTQ